MNILIIGAVRGVGQHLVEQTLAGVLARKISRADVAKYLLREMTTSKDAASTVLVDGTVMPRPRKRATMACAEQRAPC